MTRFRRSAPTRPGVADATCARFASDAIIFSGFNGFVGGNVLLTGGDGFNQIEQDTAFFTIGGKLSQTGGSGGRLSA